MSIVSPMVDSREEFGEFKGQVRTEWVQEPGNPNRKMKLLESFEYVDPNSTSWLVPKNTVVDGASIPRFFWRVIGSPFVGNYREASVVHDYYCEIENRPWKKVHQMFYFACLAGGVSEVKAKIMYAAVYVGGPRWETRTITVQPQSNRTSRSTDEVDLSPRQTRKIKVDITTKFDESVLEQELKWIEETNPELSQIEEKLEKMVNEVSLPNSLLDFNPNR